MSQPAVTPDLLLLRLFYRDFLQTFPSLKAHDLVWRCVQGECLQLTGKHILWINRLVQTPDHQLIDVHFGQGKVGEKNLSIFGECKCL